MPVTIAAGIGQSTEMSVAMAAPTRRAGQHVRNQISQDKVGAGFHQSPVLTGEENYFNQSFKWFATKASSLRCG